MDGSRNNLKNLLERSVDWQMLFNADDYTHWKHTDYSVVWSVCLSLVCHICATPPLDADAIWQVHLWAPMTRLLTVTHPSTNRARRRLTLLMSKTPSERRDLAVQSATHLVRRIFRCCNVVLYVPC